eukprot:6724638-Alexandrium_andersonii.AAC.1
MKPSGYGAWWLLELVHHETRELAPAGEGKLAARGGLPFPMARLRVASTSPALTMRPRARADHRPPSRP